MQDDLYRITVWKNLDPDAAGSCEAMCAQVDDFVSEAGPIRTFGATVGEALRRLAAELDTLGPPGEDKIAHLQGDAEAIWQYNPALGMVQARGESTEGKLTAWEYRWPPRETEAR